MNSLTLFPLTGIDAHYAMHILWIILRCWWRPMPSRLGGENKHVVPESLSCCFLPKPPIALFRVRRSLVLRRYARDARPLSWSPMPVALAGCRILQFSSTRSWSLWDRRRWGCDLLGNPCEEEIPFDFVNEHKNSQTSLRVPRQSSVHTFDHRKGLALTIPFFMWTWFCQAVRTI